MAVHVGGDYDSCCLIACALSDGGQSTTHKKGPDHNAALMDCVLGGIHLYKAKLSTYIGRFSAVTL